MQIQSIMWGFLKNKVAPSYITLQETPITLCQDTSKARTIAFEQGWVDKLTEFDKYDGGHKVRWGDSYGGYGEHYYEYNHGPDGYEDAPKYPAPGYSKYPPQTNYV